MQIFTQIEEFSSLKQPISLTIGNFDGVHRGHQGILKRLRETRCYSVVLTFSNHPAHVLQKEPVSQITSLSHRLFLLEQFAVDATVLIPFTLPFSQQSPLQFLTYLKRFLTFSHLILGHDAVIGYKRQGEPSHLLSLSNLLDFSLEYHEPIQIGETIVSSSAIRTLLNKGELTKVNQFLGRPYSIRTKVVSGMGKGQRLGFPTANLPVEGLALPPKGVYAVEAVIQDKTHLGIANLGTAPTLHEARNLFLEVHLFDFEKTLYGEEIEVIFHQFIREEKKFPSLEALKQQIRCDISSAFLGIDKKTANQLNDSPNSSDSHQYYTSP